jgi:hypothetical protein
MASVDCDSAATGTPTRLGPHLSSNEFFRTIAMITSDIEKAGARSSVIDRTLIAFPAFRSAAVRTDFGDLARTADCYQINGPIATPYHQ